MSIEAILQRLAQGEQRAFAELVDLYQRPLFGFLGRLGLGQAQAEDIAQDTFLRAWTHLSDFSPERAQFATWLFTIARNLAYNALQSAPQQREITGQALPDRVCPQADPAQHLDHTQQQLRLQNALRQLPMKERSALALVYVHELGLADVARIEGDSLPAIKSRLHRAKQRLRELLHTAPHRRHPMNDELDTLLQDAALRPPPDFTQRVMRTIEQRTTAAMATRSTHSPWQRLRWLATVSGLVGTGLLGLSQLASFVFGLWIASAAL